MSTQSYIVHWTLKIESEYLKSDHTPLGVCHGHSSENVLLQEGLALQNVPRKITV